MLRELRKWTSHEPIYIGDTTSHIDSTKMELIQTILTVCIPRYCTYFLTTNALKKEPSMLILENHSANEKEKWYNPKIQRVSFR